MKTKNEVAVAFGERLWEISQERGISLNDIANVLGVSRRGVYYYMNGDKMPSYDKLIVLMKYLNVSAKDLLSW